MNNYRCMVCGYIYNPKDNNNIAFKDLDEDYFCPVCGAGKNKFEEEV